MLQIISGKFFKSNNVHETLRVAEFYTNLFCDIKIETCIGEVEYVETVGGISKYKFHYNNKIEKVSALVAVGDNEIVEQFISIFSFYFQCYANTNRNRVEEIYNLYDGSNKGYFSSILRKNIVTSEDDKIKGFSSFIQKLINAERKAYKSLIQCFYSYSNSIEYSFENIDLSYSILIYFLESLTQHFDEFKPSWNDYNQNQREKLDKILCTLDQDTAENIRDILLNDSHLKLQTRFINFITSNLSDSYFLDEASNIKLPLRKSHLKQVMKNAYDIRSKYTHILEGMKKELKFDPISLGDTFISDNDVFLTYNGLLRLCHHVTVNFVNTLDYVEDENFNWLDDIPNLMTLPLADEYWLHKAQNFQFTQAEARFNGVLRVLQHGLLTIEMKVNLLPLWKVYEQKLSQAPSTAKVTMLASYILYNNMFEIENVLEFLPNYSKIIGQYKGLLQKSKNPETLLLKIFTNVIDDVEWTLDDIVTVYSSYEKKRYKSKSISFPRYIDLIVCIVIACEYLASNKDKYFEWMTKAILDVPGDYSLQIFLKEKRDNYELIDVQDLYNKKFMINN